MRLVIGAAVSICCSSWTRRQGNSSASRHQRCQQERELLPIGTPAKQAVSTAIGSTALILSFRQNSTPLKQSSRKLLLFHGGTRTAYL